MSDLNDYDLNDKTRKCRKDRIDQEEDLDDSENGFRIVHNLIDNGFMNTPAERKVLQIAMTIKHSEDVEANSIIHQLLTSNGNNSSDQSEDENNSNEEEKIEFDNIDELVHKYGEIVLTIIDKADKIISRAAYFARLRRDVFFIQGNSKFE